MLGIEDGTKLGPELFRSVGEKLGRSDGVDEGSVDGPSLANRVGLLDGSELNDGKEVGLVVGSSEGYWLGTSVIVGKVEGEGAMYDLQYPQLFGQALLTMIPFLYVSQ